MGDSGVTAAASEEPEDSSSSPALVKWNPLKDRPWWDQAWIQALREDFQSQLQRMETEAETTAAAESASLDAFRRSEATHPSSSSAAATPAASPSLDVNFAFHDLPVKVRCFLLYALCEYRMQVSKEFGSHLREFEISYSRVLPCGYDGHGNAYYRFSFGGYRVCELDGRMDNEFPSHVHPSFIIYYLSNGMLLILSFHPFAFVLCWSDRSLNEGPMVDPLRSARHLLTAVEYETEFRQSFEEDCTVEELEDQIADYEHREYMARLASKRSKSKSASKQTSASTLGPSSSSSSSSSSNRGMGKTGQQHTLLEAFRRSATAAGRIDQEQGLHSENGGKEDGGEGNPPGGTASPSKKHKSQSTEDDSDVKMEIQETQEPHGRKSEDGDTKEEGALADLEIDPEITDPEMITYLRMMQLPNEAALEILFQDGSQEGSRVRKRKWNELGEGGMEEDRISPSSPEEEVEEVEDTLTRCREPPVPEWEILTRDRQDLETLIRHFKSSTLDMSVFLLKLFQFFFSFLFFSSLSLSLAVHSSFHPIGFFRVDCRERNLLQVLEEFMEACKVRESSSSAVGQEQQQQQQQQETREEETKQPQPDNSASPAAAAAAVVAEEEGDDNRKTLLPSRTSSRIEQRRLARQRKLAAAQEEILAEITMKQDLRRKICREIAESLLQKDLRVLAR